MGILDGNGENLVSPDVQGEGAERADLVESVQRLAEHCERERIPVPGVDHLDVLIRTIGILPTVELQVFQARFRRAVEEHSRQRSAARLRLVSSGVAAVGVAVAAVMLCSPPGCSVLQGDSEDSHVVNQGQAAANEQP
jgi:hypothetical protein